MPLSEKELAELKRKRDQRDNPQKPKSGKNPQKNGAQQPMQQQMPYQGMYGQPMPQPTQQQMMEMYQQQLMQQQMQQMQMQQMQMPRFTEPQVEAFMLADAITAAMDVVGKGLIHDRLIRAREIICRNVGINESAIYGVAEGYVSPIDDTGEEEEDEGELEEYGEDEDLDEAEEPEDHYNGDMPEESIG